MKSRLGDSRLIIFFLASRPMFFAGLFYLLTLPIAVLAIRFTNKRDLAEPGCYHANRLTVLLHTVGALVLTAGFIISGLQNAAV